MIQEALEEARRLAHDNRLEGKDLDELAELEDEEDEDFLEQYKYLYPTFAPSNHKLTPPKAETFPGNGNHPANIHIQPSLPYSKA